MIAKQKSPEIGTKLDYYCRVRSVPSPKERTSQSVSAHLEGDVIVKKSAYQPLENKPIQLLQRGICEPSEDVLQEKYTAAEAAGRMGQGGKAGED